MEKITPGEIQFLGNAANGPRKRWFQSGDAADFAGRLTFDLPKGVDGEVKTRLDELGRAS